jgi:outer membrane protein OmpA-like peptidoglycan-associated protein
MNTTVIGIIKSFAVHFFLLTAVLGGCGVTTGVKPPSEALLLDQAVVHATDDIMAQAQERAGIFARMSNKTLVIDPLLDGGSAQQTVVMQEIEQQIGERVRSNHTQWQILPFASGNVSQAQYLLVGTLSPTQQGGADRVLRLSLALTELKTGVIAAQSNVLVLDQGLDRNPTRYHRDSPIVVRDASTDAYARTADTKPGEKADAGYIGNVVTSALINEATAAYNEERYSDALDLYTRAAASPGGDQLRVFSGVYLTSWKLGRADEAEKAFGNIVAFGVANNNLGLKILFRPRSTDFWPDPKVSGAYMLWLRQIARQVSASKMCLNLIGHASRTGTEQFNEKLSLQRAASIKQRLESESPALSPRMRFTGMGYRENLVGTGTDDVRDALDRRVEFKVMTCP